MADRVQICEKCDAYAEETWSLKGGQGMAWAAATFCACMNCGRAHSWKGSGNGRVMEEPFDLMGFLGIQAFLMEEAQAVRVLKALADEAALPHGADHRAAGELSCGELGAHFDLAQPTVSHHLKILVDAGVLRTRRAGTRASADARAG